MAAHGARRRIRHGVWNSAIGALVLVASAARAESPELEDEADRYEATERPGEDEEAFGRVEPVLRPWTLALWLPANANSNIALSQTGTTRGTVLAPELTVGRWWGSGPVRLMTEAGSVVSTVLPDPSRDTSGWWGTIEVQTGDSATGVAPYISWEPLTLHEAVFGRHLVTFHTLTLGLRRVRGPTALHAFVRRREGSAGVATRNTLALHLTHAVPLQASAVLAVRVDGELRPYDSDAAGRRTDFRARARTRLTVPLGHGVDLALTADVQRNWSNRIGQSHTNVVIGPALSARLGF